MGEVPLYVVPQSTYAGWLNFGISFQIIDLWNTSSFITSSSVR